MGRGAIVAAVVVGLGVAGFLLLRSGEEAPRPVLEGPVPSPAPVPGRPAAEKKPPPPAPAVLLGDGMAEGLLLRSLTGAPLQGTVRATTRTGAVLSEGTTPDGSFRLRGLPRGEEVDLVCASPGLLPRRFPRLPVPREGSLELGYVFLGEGQRLDILVVDALGAPVEGCALSVESLPSTERTTPEATASTDPAGRAAFPALPPGRWLLLATAAGHARAAVSVDLVEGALREPRRIVLAPGYAVEGRILHAGGAPAAGARVSFLPADPRGEWWPSSAPSAVADGEGRFRLDGVPAGATTVVVHVHAGVTETAAHVEVPLKEPLEIRLAARAEVKGRVVDDGTGTPIEGATVRVVLEEASAEGLTGPDGTFRFPGLPGFPLRLVHATREGYAPSDYGQDLEIRLRRGAVLRGVVRERDGRPIPYAWVEVMVWRDRNDVVSPDQVRSDEEGRYRIAGLLPGRGLLQAGGRNRHLSGVPDDPWEALRRGETHESCTVEIPAEGEAVKDLVLVPDSRVEGRILRRDGTPAAGFVVRVESEESPGGGVEGTASAADGSFVVEDLAPATERVVAAYGPAGRVGVSAPFDLVESEATRGVLVTVSGPGSMAGRVRREDGRPAVGATLHLVARRFDPERPWEFNYGRRQETPVPVAADGTFLAEGLAPGPWTPIASALDCLERRGDAVEVADGERRDGIDLVLAAAHATTGRVLDPAGLPAAGARVTQERVRPEPPGEGEAEEVEAFDVERGRGILTDAEGRFRIPGLEAGTYAYTAAKDGFVPARATAEAGATDVVLRLGEGLPIQGKVVEEGTGKPVKGVTVWVTGSAGESLRSTTGPDGAFDLRGLAPGACDLYATDDAESFVAKKVRGVAAGARGVVIEVSRGLVLAGRVEDAGGQPLDIGALVVEIASITAPAQGYSSREQEVEAGGVFSFSGLAPGRYRITIGVSSWSDGKRAYVPRTVEAEAGTRDLVIPLARGKPIAGRVVLPDGSSPKKTNYSVSLSPSRGGEVPGGQGSFSTEDDGTFVTIPLPDGVLFDLEVQDGQSGTAAAVRDVQPGATGVVLRLDAGGTIRGRVVDPEGKPVAGAAVRARAARGSGVGSASEAGADGTFLLEGLPAGNYRLYATSAEQNLAEAEPVGTVAVGSVDAVVKTTKGHEFRARVISADGMPLRDAFAFIERMERTTWEAPTSWPVEEGLLVMRGLPKCRVRVRIVRDGETVDFEDAEGIAGPFEVPGEEPTITVR